MNENYLSSPLIRTCMHGVQFSPREGDRAGKEGEEKVCVFLSLSLSLFARFRRRRFRFRSTDHEAASDWGSGFLCVKCTYVRWGKGWDLKVLESEEGGTNFSFLPQPFRFEAGPAGGNLLS